MNMIELLICFLNSSLMVYTFILFFSSFSKSRCSKLIYISFIVWISVAYTIVLWVIPLGITRTLLLISMPLFVSLLFKFKWYNYIVLSLSIFALGSIAELVVAAMLSLLFSISPNAAVQGTYKIIGIILSKLLIIVLIIIFRFKKYKIHYAVSQKKFFVLLLLPISAIAVVLVHVYWFLQIPFSSQPLSISNIISYMVLIVGNITTFQIVDSSYRNAEKDKQLATAQELIQTQAEQYTQMQEHNLAVVKMRHDHKNYLIGLINELEKGNTETALNSLRDEYRTLNTLCEIESKYNIVSTLIKAKSDLAKKSNINIDFSYQELDKIRISSIDLAILLGNAIDNAIEATQKTVVKNRTIDVSVKLHNNLIVVIIRNPVVYNVDVNNLMSTKRGGKYKGFGIISMKNIAKKYDGEVILTCDNQMFNTRIILRNSINE